MRAAEAALGAGDREGGATRLRRAAELAQRLGARPLTDDIAVLARRARITVGQPGEAAATQPVPGQLPGPDRLGLTARELEVLFSASKTLRWPAAEPKEIHVTPGGISGP